MKEIYHRYLIFLLWGGILGIIGFAIGFGFGFNQGINFIVNQVLSFLHAQGFNFTATADQISRYIIGIQNEIQYSTRSLG